MSDLPILTPSECAALAAIEAKMTPGPWLDDADHKCIDRDESSAALFSYASKYASATADDAIGIVELRNAAPRMLATIAALRWEVEGWEDLNRSRSPFCEHFTAYTFSPDGGKTMFCTLCRVAAHEATIAELKRQLEERT